MALGPLKKDTALAPLYEADFFRWTQEQGRALRERRPSGIDWENVSEEIESLGRSDKRSIESNLGVVLLHLLKWRYQADKRKSEWKSTIAEHRARVRKLVSDSPSLRGYPAEVLAEEYALARLKASDETGLPEDRFPDVCPFSAAEVLDGDFWPEAFPT
jgi:Domain of unknown function DUF29